ncbi:P-loop containing nucleoside triphosphate hydrolase protein [Protomyces lactucae-debilis]|uniref:p-loop containing nucleoside triphosphate hydrolase protein n=1 Tax=Protomyces lactucae-debilis TaxID=2754530 RepID=A0A1Y2FMA3_PROLT|nr:P-loop containing nucleoside triphosphate hydrolase protein [Protomyces lactucae-debilis]ORY83905.1 P-loop containing nucleoside triphosphate hydrolase protein [Protomyces lactucae-debilis]
MSSNAVLLQGLKGSGKTFLVEDVAAVLGRQADLVRIHLGDQTDAKLLIGTYVTSATPGQFTWQAGLLTNAVKAGKWLLIEDIDKAPKEVLSVLLPLMESGRILIPSRDETIAAAPGFRLLATRTVSAGGKRITNRMLGARLWHQVDVRELPIAEVRQVMVARYPVLSAMADTLLRVWHVVSSMQHTGRSADRTARGRPLGTQDLLKWARRIVAVFSDNNILSPSDTLPSNVTDDIFSEAVDCFAATSSSPSIYEAIVTDIGVALEYPPERVQLYLKSHTPTITETKHSLAVGRVALAKKANMSKSSRSRPFAYTSSALRVLEQLMVACKFREPILLVGETGTGKTTVVQQLANTLGHKLVAINMSQQTESGDLLGGFKPVDTRSLAVPVIEAFEFLFEKTLSASKNAKFLAQIRRALAKGQWRRFATLLREAYKIAVKKLDRASPALDGDEAQRKRRKLDHSLLTEWQTFSATLDAFDQAHEGAQKAFSFAFVEGTLVRAMRNGDWVLLDEINLSAPDTLESINGLLQEIPSIVLTEKGDLEPIVAHPDFRLFACMNPATDVGKKDLPSGVRAQFTELYVHSPDANMQDLLAIIAKYIGGLTLEDNRACDDVASLYMTAKKLALENSLVDGAGQRPHYSIRTLSRTLSYVAEICPLYGLRRSLYEGFCMSYLTLLDAESEALLLPIIEQATIARVRNAKSLLFQAPKRPVGDEWIQFKHYWLHQGPLVPQEDARYILTPFVEKNLLNLVRASATRKFPILLQGPTSSGKTSLVEYLAKRTGHNFVRINNHEHTDLQEYLGGYTSDAHGALVFQEGLLVQAVPLNRLLDDNRELLIPETQEVVKPHPNFMLFATQNPPGLYGGRKHLSRAFRNRFLELHVDDIPEEELETILCQRCQVAPSYCKRIVEVYKMLSLRRQSTRVFEQKSSFATLRDLFRWATRPAVGYEQLAVNGYYLLAERVRRSDEREVVKEVIEKVMKVTLADLEAYDIAEMPEYKQLLSQPDALCDIVWTTAMRRLFKLLALAFRNREPVLLVGETGCGKTTVCQKMAYALGRPIKMLNAHQNTETSDLIGALRPHVDRLGAIFAWADGPLVEAMRHGEIFLLDEISLAEDSVLERLNSVLETKRTLVLAEKGADDDAHVDTNDNFQFCATMNPGGDFGKKELSPALRNRFTEIWVPAVSAQEDIIQIVNAALNDTRKLLCMPMIEFAEWFASAFSGPLNSTSVSIRDLLACLTQQEALVHGAALVYIDALGASTSSSVYSESDALQAKRQTCLAMLSQFAGFDCRTVYEREFLFQRGMDSVSIGPFSLTCGHVSPANELFHFAAPTTHGNATRVFRASQLRKPILLEGSPGVGKTSLITAIARAARRELVRINFSEQTDLMDLFGSDTPVEDNAKIEFAWRDAPFLQAMQSGSWVLLDEMNLASQAILEGLNACLDYRAEAYIPELGRSFPCHPDFRVFAAQNPHGQGGGRKGLPKSFINRFTVVYCDPLMPGDLDTICRTLYPSIHAEAISSVVSFMADLDQLLGSDRTFGSLGQPWEFNLRDMLRWLSITSVHNSDITIRQFAHVIVRERFRSETDRAAVDALCDQHFSKFPPISSPSVSLTRSCFKIGLAEIARSINGSSMGTSFSGFRGEHNSALESIIHCLNQNWPCILVGSSGCGKSKLLENVAHLLGHTLSSLTMTSDMDSSDLLGGYEQRDLTRSANILFAKARHQLLEFLRARSDQPQIDTELDSLAAEFDQPTAGHFQWADGSLVHAVKNGSWLVLDNANLCNPSVLDRLNSLLETDGVLTVNERVLTNGEPMVIVPHKDFRLFLTMDPQNGELSRAMRNRGVEIFVLADDSFWTCVDRTIAEGEVDLQGQYFAPIDAAEVIARRLPVSGRSRDLPVENSNVALQVAAAHKDFKGPSAELGTPLANFQVAVEALTIAWNGLATDSKFWNVSLDAGARSPVKTHSLLARHLENIFQTFLSTSTEITLSPETDTILKQWLKLLSFYLHQVASAQLNLDLVCVFLTKFKGLLERNLSPALGLDSDALRNLVHLPLFQPQSRGQCLDILWKRLRPLTPKSLSAIEMRDALIATGIKLDDLSWSSGALSGELIDLQMILFELLQQAYVKEHPASQTSLECADLDKTLSPSTKLNRSDQGRDLFRKLSSVILLSQLIDYESWQDDEVVSIYSFFFDEV